jgi:glutamate-ammonia-ligase adenylyltransferase
MGKHGAGELNYSSDIDLIVLYDPERAPLKDPMDAAQVYVRLTRQIVAIMQDRTADGYVFRTDLRLRPDPRATQIAISMDAAANYYESMGQNWERAAMIKARAVAGDIDLGREFLRQLTPFVYRKYLDFAAIADVQSLKRQMHTHKGHGTIAVLGHNIKVGRGGIREIEFFVQTQQLIAGGRNPALRGSKTLAVLQELVDEGWIEQSACDELSERLCVPAHHRAPPANGGRPADPGNACHPAGLRRLCRFLWLRKPARPRQPAHCHTRHRAGPLCSAVRRRPGTGQ